MSHLGIEPGPLRWEKEPFEKLVDGSSEHLLYIWARDNIFLIFILLIFDSCRKSASWLNDRMCVQCVRLGQEEARILLAPLAPSLISQFVKLQADRSTFHAKVLLTSVADPGCLSRIPGPNFSILDPNFFNPESRIRIKEFKYFNPKNSF